MEESSFFGHVRGAFTGATGDHKGLFEQAHQGTLFLDEIGEMALPLQAKLLRVLEQRQIMPVGGTKEKAVDVRILAGTNADLLTEISANHFRQDLYFRLAVYTINVPPLRARSEDIPLLAEYLLRTLSIEMGVPTPEVAPEAMQALQ